ncbi:unnamed protein product [Echinostoma caproni]|uniref:Ras-GAP domain-containing protein n=1 Tax=Echinostoma caproni TaxID=27848 RepID=A0A183AV35_9TREM|nr:unnamed protein product [Echinostoma caproni]
MVFKALTTALKLNAQDSKIKSSGHRTVLTKAMCPKELRMYLSACKFLATCLLMPEYKAPQFPFYRWVFVDEVPSSKGSQSLSRSSSANVPQSFIPYITEVTKLLQLPVPQDNVMLRIPGTLKAVFNYYSVLLESIRESSETPLAALNVLSRNAVLTEAASFGQVVTWYGFIKTLAKCLETRSNNPTDHLINSSTAENGVILELALEAALAQEFPEAIASR